MLDWRAGTRNGPPIIHLSSRDGAEDLTAQLASAGVVVDVLINNAGRSIRRPGSEASGRLHLRADDGAELFRRAPAHARVVTEHARAETWSRHQRLLGGVRIGTPLFSAYVASKTALDRFTRIAASEARSDGVSFTTVHMPLVRKAELVAQVADRESKHAEAKKELLESKQEEDEVRNRVNEAKSE